MYTPSRRACTCNVLSKKVKSIPNRTRQNTKRGLQCEGLIYDVQDYECLRKTSNFDAEYNYAREKEVNGLQRPVCRRTQTILERRNEMTLREAIKNRHSVRKYLADPITAECRDELENCIQECNEESGLHLQIIYDEPGCFDTLFTKYGMFVNVRNYIAIVGDKSEKAVEERAGYHGQKIVLLAQQLGLNTCWVAGTFNRGKCSAEILPGEKLLCVIAIGYGEDQGVPHKSKPVEKLCGIKRNDMPGWFRNGVVGAMMAPTAMNQQKFFITLEDNEALITTRRGILTAIDLGIVQYNFEAASGHACRIQVK